MIFIRVVKQIKRRIRMIQVALCTSNTLKPFDENWFKGKRVAIVGGADSVLESPLGNYIDSFDVVVRINKGVEIIAQQKEFVGNKTDFLFHAFYVRENCSGSSPITVELWNKNKVGRVIFAYNYKCSNYSLFNLLYFLKVTKGKYNFTQLTKELYYKNMKSILPPYGPTTGFIAINTIFNCQPKEIYITGFTFFKTPTNPVYRNISVEKINKVMSEDHSAELEYIYVKKLYEDNRNMIKVDDVLYKIFLKN